MREEYLSPVGFATEPAEERKRWTLRIVTALLVLFVGWLALNKVIRTEGDPRTPPPPSQLPGPL